MYVICDTSYAYKGIVYYTRIVLFYIYIFCYPNGEFASLCWIGSRRRKTSAKRIVTELENYRLSIARQYRVYFSFRSFFFLVLCTALMYALLSPTPRHFPFHFAISRQTIAEECTFDEEKLKENKSMW